MNNKIDKIIDNILEEYMNGPINENLDHSLNYLYHYTSIDCLCSILNDNSFQLSRIDSYTSKEDMHKNCDIYPYYMSLTRVCDCSVGYTSARKNNIVRLIFNTEKLKQISNSSFVSHSFMMDFNNGISGKAQQIKLSKHGNGWVGLNENEERFISKEPTIHNVLNYIVSIDVFANEGQYNADTGEKNLIDNNLKLLKIINFLSHSEYINKIHFFNDYNSFKNKDYSKEIDFDTVKQIYNYSNMYLRNYKDFESQKYMSNYIKTFFFNYDLKHYMDCFVFYFDEPLEMIGTGPNGYQNYGYFDKVIYNPYRNAFCDIKGPNVKYLYLVSAFSKTLTSFYEKLKSRSYSLKILCDYTNKEYSIDDYINLDI